MLSSSIFKFPSIPVVNYSWIGKKLLYSTSSPSNTTVPTHHALNDKVRPLASEMNQFLNNHWANVKSHIFEILLDTFVLGGSISSNEYPNKLPPKFHKWLEDIFWTALRALEDDPTLLDKLIQTMEQFKGKDHPSTQLLQLFWNVIFPVQVKNEELVQQILFSTLHVESLKTMSKSHYYMLQYVKLWYYMKTCSSNAMHRTKLLELIQELPQEDFPSVSFAKAVVSFYNKPSNQKFSAQEVQQFLQETETYLKTILPHDLFAMYFLMELVYTCSNDFKEVDWTHWKELVSSTFEQFHSAPSSLKKELIANYIIFENDEAYDGEATIWLKTLRIQLTDRTFWNAIQPAFKNAAWSILFAPQLQTKNEFERPSMETITVQLIDAAKLVYDNLITNSVSYSSWKEEYYNFLNIYFALIVTSQSDASVLQEWVEQLPKTVNNTNLTHFVLSHAVIIGFISDESLQWMESQKLSHPLSYEDFTIIMNPLKAMQLLIEDELAYEQTIELLEPVLTRDSCQPLATFVKCAVMDRKFVMGDPTLAGDLINQVKLMTNCLEAVPQAVEAARLTCDVVSHISTLEDVSTDANIQRVVDCASHIIDEHSDILPIQFKLSQIDALLLTDQLQDAVPRFYTLIVDTLERNQSLEEVKSMIRNKSEWLQSMLRGILLSFAATSEKGYEQVARSAFDNSIAKNENAINLAQRGCFHLEMGDITKAEEDLNKSFRMEPKSAQTNYFLSLLCIEKLKHLNPEVLELKMDATMLHLTPEQEQQKDTLVQQSLEYLYNVYDKTTVGSLESKFVSIHKTLALLFYLKGMFEESSTMFGKHIQVMRRMKWNKKVAEGLHLRAQVLLVRKRYFEALDDLEAIQKEYEDYPHKVDISYLKEWIKELQLNQLIHTS